ncbi:MAG: MFS transporter, partial [Enhydrobacter sp.]
MSVSAAAARSAPTFIIVLLSVAAFAAAANMRVLDPLLIQLSDEFHVTIGAASIATTLFLLANGVFVLVHGPFGDRYGKLPVVAIACIAAALCCAASALAVSLGMLAGTRFLTGVTSSAIIPLAIAWLGDNVGYEKRQAILHRLADLMDEHADELAMADTRDMGKPVVQSHHDVARSSLNIRFFADHA